MRPRAVLKPRVRHGGCPKSRQRETVAADVRRRIVRRNRQNQSGRGLPHSKTLPRELRRPISVRFWSAAVLCRLSPSRRAEDSTAYLAGFWLTGRFSAWIRSLRFEKRTAQVIAKRQK